MTATTTTADQTLRLYPLGEGAIVLELVQQAEPSPHRQALQQLADRLHQQPTPALRDCVLGRDNLTIIFDPLHLSTQGCQQWILTQWRQQQNSPPAADSGTQCTVEIPVYYGGEYGPDLPAVAAHCGLTTEEVIAGHCSAEYRVCFIGFQPGFAYLDGLDPRLHCPRKAEPRRRIVAGSVAIGGAQTAVYPLDSPGGWQIIGHYTLQDSAPLFDPQRRPAARLQAGNRVRFIAQPWS